MPEDEYDNAKKAHVKRKSGKKAEKKKGKEGHEQVRVVVSYDLGVILMVFFTGNDRKTAQPKGICRAEYHEDRAEGQEEG